MKPDKKLEPDDLLHFVELDEFSDDWTRLGLDVEQDLWDLQSVIMSNPRGAPIVPGTNGLRKLRYSSRESNIGKSGGIRVLYAYFSKYWIVLLVMAYGKVRKSNLTVSEKSAVKTYLHNFEQWLQEKSA